ncbi:MAG: hypothetical protein IJG84_03090 [Kiritimatiellae bacterium]|nr:hypothetical protein [Kiritimatiellia bacterium]
MPVSTRPPERNVSGIALPIFCIVAALLVLGGGLWYRGQQRKQAEWRRIVAAQKAEEEARQRAEDERRAQEAAHEKMLAVEKSARDRDSCIANLKQIEAAMEQCLIGGKIPTPEHLYGPDRYLRNEPTCPLGGHYKINKSDEGYTVVCPHADEGHRWPLSGAPNIITANWEVVPSARLVSKVGSREVFGATFRMDGLEYTSPVVLDNLQGRASIGPFKVTYSENNKRYEGAFTAIPINWRGSKTYTFSLKEITAPRHGDARKRVQLWEGGPYWATVNIGAEEPWERGCYFWWGDTVGYKRVGDSWVASDGSRRGFSFKEGNVPTYNKSSSTLRSEGWIIEGGILAPEHDAAQVQWGGGWRMPTGQELSGLNNKCDFTWATKNGVEGYIVRGRGDYASNSIFLPCAGYGDGTSLYSAGAGGHYWSSVPRSDYYYAWDLNFDSSYPYADYSNRSNGQSVRPVQGFTK